MLTKRAVEKMAPTMVGGQKKFGVCERSRMANIAFPRLILITFNQVVSSHQYLFPLVFI